MWARHTATTQGDAGRISPHAMRPADVGRVPIAAALLVVAGFAAQRRLPKA